VLDSHISVDFYDLAAAAFSVPASQIVLPYSFLTATIAFAKP
jgi:hypothetical protein